MLEIASGEHRFVARLEDAAAQTVEAFRRLLPLESRIIHARWSGEACWIPFGELDLGVGAENATSYPAPGELLLYPGGISETELLFPYGPTCFASKAGQLAGNHFATIAEGTDRLADLGPKVSGRAPNRSGSLSSKEPVSPPSGGEEEFHPPPGSSLSSKGARVCASAVPIVSRSVHSRET